MSEQPFEVLSDDEGVLWLSGELDLDQADVLSRVAAQHVDSQRSVVLDCSKLTFINSSGLRAILGFASIVPDGVVLRDAPWDVRVVFNLAGVDEAVGVRIELST